MAKRGAIHIWRNGGTTLVAGRMTVSRLMMPGRTSEESKYNNENSRTQR